MASDTTEVDKAKLICQRWWKLHGSEFKGGQWLFDLQHQSGIVSGNGQCGTAFFMVESLMNVLQSWRNGRSDPPVELIRDEVLIVLFQCLVRLLISQNCDGSWGFGGSRAEETQFGIESIRALSQMSIARPLATKIGTSLQCASDYLQAPSNLCNDHTCKFSVELDDITAISPERLPKLTDFYASLPHFKSMPQWVITASIVEGFLFRSILTSPDYMLYHDKDVNRWLDYILSVLSLSNNAAGFACSTEIVFGQMLQMSFLYQIDSFMEHIMETHKIKTIDIVYKLVNEAFDSLLHYQKDPQDFGAKLMTASTRVSQKGKDIYSLVKSGLPASPPLTPRDGTSPAGSRTSSLDPEDLNIVSARSTISMFVSYMRTLPTVSSASEHNRLWFLTELRDFFLTQTRQVEEKEILSSSILYSHNNPPKSSPAFPAPRGTYFRWANTIGAGSIGSPHLFAYMCCQLENESPIFSSVEEIYLAERMSQHLATMCRMENDMGGIRRDRIDCTVNSVNFPEFNPKEPEQDKQLAKTLLRLAGREREAWKSDYESLEELARGNREKELLCERFKFFTGFVTAYGEIHLAKDPWWVKADGDP